MDDKTTSSEDVKTSASEVKTNAQKDYELLYNNMKVETQRKEAKYKEKLKEFESIQSKMSEYEKAQLDAEEKDKIKKGKQSEVIAEQKAKLETLEKYESFYNSYKEKQELKLKEQLDLIPEAEKDFVQKILNKTDDVSEKFELLGDFMKRFKTSDRGQEPGEKVKAKESHKDKTDDEKELERLIEKKKNGKLRPSEQIKYLSLI